MAGVPAHAYTYAAIRLPMTTRRQGMTKGLRFGLGSGLVFGLLAAAHATDPLSLVTNHATVLACTDCDVPGMPLFTTFGSEMSFPLLALARRAGLEQMPASQKWLQTVQQRAAWQRAIDQGGELSLPG